MTEKRKIVRMRTPLATFKWPKLVEPDYGTKEFPKPEGIYTTKLVFDEADAKFNAFRRKLEPYMDAAIAAGREQFDALKKPQRDKLKDITINDLFVPIYDENDEPTGQVEMKVSMKASGEVKKGPRAGRKWTRSPDLYDALGRKIKDAVKKGLQIWGGTEGIVAFSFAEGGYFIPATGACGISLQLEAVQIVTLRAGGDRDHGFEAQDGGWDADDHEAQEKDEDGDDEFAGGDDAGGDPDGAADF